jgi:hypothetical protein
MAWAFGCNPQVAGETARELAQVRADMASMGRTFQGYQQTTGSRRVAAALDRFFSESSDNRARMDKLLERAAGLLQALAEGTAAVDQELAGALEPNDPTPTGSAPNGVSSPAAAGTRR